MKYEENAAKWNTVVKNTAAAFADKKAVSKKQINLGLIGAGLFARTTMLPIMQAGGLYHFKGLATTGGIASAQANEVFPFDYTTNDYRKLLSDPDIDLIAVSTQHNSHAKFIVEALTAGKNVYVEKPLCLTLEELARIEEAYKNSQGELFCGLNRRHAPLIKEIKRDLQTDKIPAVYDYIANAGYIPPDHWTQDESKGGGRIIGEAVHFIDTIQSLDGSELVELKVSFAANPAYPKKDNAVISLRFASGAIGTVLYTSMGSKKYPKEQLRVFSNGSVYVMDNYVGLVKYGSSKKKETKLKQDKGIGDEYRYIFDVVNGKRKNGIINDALISHKLLIKELEKCKNGCNEGI